MDLQWLRVPRIQHKLCRLVYGSLHGTAPGYLSDLTASVGSAARRQLCSASNSELVVPPTHRASIMETVRSPLQVHERGTVYRQPSAQPPNRSLPSKKNLRDFLDCHFLRDNVYNIHCDYCSSNSSYRKLRYISRIDYITLHYAKPSAIAIYTNKPTR